MAVIALLGKYWLKKVEHKTCSLCHQPGRLLAIRHIPQKISTYKVKSLLSSEDFLKAGLDKIEDVTHLLHAADEIVELLYYED